VSQHGGAPTSPDRSVARKHQFRTLDLSRASQPALPDATFCLAQLVDLSLLTDLLKRPGRPRCRTYTNRRREGWNNDM
jgi:hypothetical protein